MPIVQFTSNLKRFHPGIKEINIDAKTIAELIEKVDERFPGLKNYIVDDQSSLRDHVNIFINENMIKDRTTLKDHLGQKDKVFFMQALSGG